MREVHWQRSRMGQSPLPFRKNVVRFFQRFLAANVQPLPGDLERVHTLARIKPLQEPARLIWIIPGREVGGEERQDSA